MKHCPKCNRKYADDSQRFCLDDGTVLVIEIRAPAYEAQPTLRMQPQTAPRSRPAPTVPSVEKEPSARRQLWPLLVGLAALGFAILLITGWWFSARSGDELLYQTRYDNTGRMRLLLLLGANANARDATESTPLIGAAWRGQTDAVKLLLGNGADINARNIRNETPLILAAKEGHSDIVRMLLDKNPDLNAKDINGWTSLMWAAWGGYLDTTKLLLSTGIRVGARNNSGETAQSLAAKRSHYDVAMLLDKADSTP